MGDFAAAREKLERHGQDHVLRFWNDLSEGERGTLLTQIDSLDLGLVDSLTHKWIRDTPAPAHFSRIEPVPVIETGAPLSPQNQEAFAAGEAALRAGRVGLVLVAGGQGTRLGFDGPKGAYPIGSVTGRTIFEFHADKIHNLQRRYGCVLPWYIMVGETNEAQTKAFFRDHGHFGLNPADIMFFTQRMMPCVSVDGKLLLETPSRLASNPNGHGGCIPAMVECGVIADAKRRGIDTLSYFQVDNWAVKVADPLFIGHHILRNGKMSSKICPKTEPRESVGIHCLCDGVYQVIEYTELDIYPQLLETGPDGKLVHFAGNTAIHVLSVGFIEETNRNFANFPWHCSHKKIPYLDEKGVLIKPEKNNGYKFETFVFDALQYTNHLPIALEIGRLGEYTPTKQPTGPNSVEEAQNDMNQLWGSWIEAAGGKVKRDPRGSVITRIEINPRFALTHEEFVERSAGRTWPANAGALAIGAEGEIVVAR